MAHSFQAQIVIDGVQVTLAVGKPKTFSTGSTGFYASTKATSPSNPDEKYQISVQAVLIGSKPKGG